MEENRPDIVLPEWVKQSYRKWGRVAQPFLPEHPDAVAEKIFTALQGSLRETEGGVYEYDDPEATLRKAYPEYESWGEPEQVALIAGYLLVLATLVGMGSAPQLDVDELERSLTRTPQESANIEALTAMREALQLIRNTRSYLDALQNAVDSALSAIPRPPRRPRRRPDLPDVLKMPNDPVSRLTPIALGKMREWGHLPPDYADVPFGILLDGGREVRGKAAVGLSVADEVTLGIWREVGKHGAMAVKAHLLLWTYYLEAQERRENLVALHLNDACRFLGIQPHPRGGYRARDRQKALETLNLVLKMAVDLELSPRRKGKKEVKPYIRGALWDRYEAGTRYHDLFGEDPLLIVYRPSILAEQLREHYQMIAQVGRPLLELHAKNDEWAVLLGTYFATLDRVNRYKGRPARVRVYTALERCGLLTDWYLRNPMQVEVKFIRAMKTLEERGIIELWALNDTGLREVEPDDDSPLPPGAVDFFRRVVTVQFPAPARGELPSDTRQ